MKKAPRFYAILVLGAAVAGHAFAESTAVVPTTSASGVDVRISTPVAVMPRFGFLPVRVSVVNNSPRDGTWQLRFQAGDAGTSTGAIGSRFRISVGAGQSHDEWFFVPLPDAAPSYTLEPLPAPVRGQRGAIPPRQVTMASVEASASVAGIESRVRGKFTTPVGQPLQWTGRLEAGDRPGETIGVATAEISITSGDVPLTGRELPLGFDADDGVNPSLGRIRRFVYKESIPDPAVGAAPKSSVWSALSSSLTAESAARSALAASGLLRVPAEIEQTVSITPLEPATPGAPVAWLTTFVQSGSARLLPLETGLAIPPGAVVNLHASSRSGEVVRTITFVEPAALLALTEKPASVGSASAPSRDAVAAVESQSILLRYGFLRPQADVVVSRSLPGDPGFAGMPQHKGATLWFESGPARLLLKPLFGSLPPDTSAYLLPGPTSDQVVRVFAVGPRARVTIPSTVAGRTAGAQAGLVMTVTGPGIVGAADLKFAGLSAGSASQALPIAATARLAAALRQALYNGQIRGAINVTAVSVDALPADWRIWSPYHAVLLRDHEYDDFNPAQRAAMDSWILQGGLLYLEPTVHDDTGMGPLEQRVPMEVERHGMGRITKLPFSMEDYVWPEDMNLDGSLWIKPAQQSDLIALLLLHTPAASLPSGEFLSSPAATA